MEQSQQQQTEDAKIDPLAAVKAYVLETYSAGTREWSSPTLRAMTGHPDYPEPEPGESRRAYVKRCTESRRAGGHALKAALREILETHKIDIQSAGKSLYRAIDSAEQGARAVKDYRRAHNALLADTEQRIAHCNHADDAAAAKARDRLSKLDSIKALSRQRAW